MRFGAALLSPALPVLLAAASAAAGPSRDTPPAFHQGQEGKPPAVAAKVGSVQVPLLPESLRKLAERGDHQRLVQELRSHPSDLAGRKPFLLGYALLRLGRHREALPAFEKAVRAVPDLASHALFFLGEAAYAAGEEARATKAFEEFLRRDPAGPRAVSAREKLARIDLRAGRPIQAAVRLAKLLRRFPGHHDSASFLATRARALEEGGKPREAALAWRALWRLHPERPEAAGALERAAALAPLARPPLEPLRARDHYRRARLLQERFHHGEALSAFQEMTRIFPRSPYRRQIAHYRARALYSLRRTKEAEEALREAVQLWPPASQKRAEARYFLSRNHLRSRDREGFEEQGRALLSESPAGTWAERILFLLARVHEDDHQYVEATHHYNELLRKHPRSKLAPKAMWQIAWIQYRGRDYEEALRGFEKIALRFPGHRLFPSALYWGGAAAERSGETERATALYRKCVQLFRHFYYGQLAQDALRRLARAGHAPAARPIPFPTAGFGRWTRPPDTPLGMASLAKWRTAEMLASMGLHSLAGEEFGRPGERSFFRYRAAWSFARAGESRQAVAIVRSAFWDAVRSGGRDLPIEFWRIAYPTKAIPRKPKRPDPLLLNAVIMAESVFDPNAFSRAGAIGLMQLMPSTGLRLARRERIRLKTARDLFDPDTNVRLGARHLEDLLREFDGAVVPAVASYNAGRKPVKRWWRRRGSEPVEVFIERIPYPETRNYVRKVLGYYREYRRIYGSPTDGSPGSGGGP